jgi:hypothetical protein
MNVLRSLEKNFDKKSDPIFSKVGSSLSPVEAKIETKSGLKNPRKPFLIIFCEKLKKKNFEIFFEIRELQMT